MTSFRPFTPNFAFALAAGLAGGGWSNHTSGDQWSVTAVGSDSRTPGLANQFVDLVTEEYPQRTLSEAGSAKP